MTPIRWRGTIAPAAPGTVPFPVLLNDSVGSAAANKALSERRVAAVRARLVERHRVDPTRLKVAGHGAARPRETNATIEGRARNRRVELVRDCTPQD